MISPHHTHHTRSAGLSFDMTECSNYSRHFIQFIDKSNGLPVDIGLCICMWLWFYFSQGNNPLLEQRIEEVILCIMPECCRRYRNTDIAPDTSTGCTTHHSLWDKVQRVFCLFSSRKDWNVGQVSLRQLWGPGWLYDSLKSSWVAFASINIRYDKLWLISKVRYRSWSLDHNWDPVYRLPLRNKNSWLTVSNLIKTNALE